MTSDQWIEKIKGQLDEIVALTDRINSTLREALGKPEPLIIEDLQEAAKSPGDERVLDALGIGYKVGPDGLRRDAEGNLHGDDMYRPDAPGVGATPKCHEPGCGRLPVPLLSGQWCEEHAQEQYDTAAM